MALAARLRDLGHGDVVTYSRKVFIPLTMLCRDHCHYCTFAKPPAKLDAPFLTPEEVVAIAEAGRAMGCKEALFTLGDRPEERYPVARAWLEERGYALDARLRPRRGHPRDRGDRTAAAPEPGRDVLRGDRAAEARLRLDGADARDLVRAARPRKGGPHFGSPDKVPAVRLRTIEDAGRLAVPFTTGILVGIGETARERAESLLAIRDVHRRYRHVQEVIVQNFRAKPGTAMQRRPGAGRRGVPRGRGRRRASCSGPRMHVQAPPNLSDPDQQLRLLDAGIDDWGGVSPLTPDHVNPEKPWPTIEALAATTAARGKELRERLTIYPEFATAARPVPRREDARPGRGADRAPTAARWQGMRPEPIAWQDPDVRWKPRDDRAHVREGRRRGAARGRARAVYGDFDALEVTRAWRADARRARAARRRHQGAPSARPSGTARSPTTRRSRCFRAEGAALEALCAVADGLRAEAVGDEVTYVINRNINFTNVCYVGCRFCAFAQRELDAESYTLTLDEVADRVEEAWDWGATEVCMQGGIHPDLPGTFYFDLLDAVKARVPADPHPRVQPDGGPERRRRSWAISFEEFLAEAKAHGLGTIPGTAAEILDDDVRWVLTKGKLPADTWEEIVRTAHGLGIRSQLHDHVRPRGRAAALGRPHPAARADPGGHGRLHGVRAAAVRAPERADLPGGQGAARAPRSRRTCGCTRWRGSCSTD